ncbi:Zinc finger BED domain-containing protein DAYSLEEPER [Bienertia sinuspersici]
MMCDTNNCKITPFNLDTRQAIVDFESKTRVNTDEIIGTVSVLNYSVLIKMKLEIAKMLIVDEFPFSFVEHEGFRHFCKVVIPDFFLSHISLLEGIVMGSTLRKETN